jgi:hypothetical protein
VIPDGWTIDAGDPSVGIFGREAVHEACPKWEDAVMDNGLAAEFIIGDDQWVEVGRTYRPLLASNGEVWGTEIVQRIRITCGCGDHFDIVETDISTLLEV